MSKARMRRETDPSTPPRSGRYPPTPDPTQAVPTAPPPPAGGRGRDAWVSAVARVVGQILGAPDYRAYLEHCERAGHAPRLTEEQYLKEFFESKGKGVRCC